MLRPFFLTPAQGAETSIYLAASDDVTGASGQYFMKCAPRRPSAKGRDAEAARRLWIVSSELTGLDP